MDCEGAKKTGKGNMPEETLRNGDKPSGNDMKAMNLANAQVPKPTGESNHETLRVNSLPKAEKHQQAPANKATIKRARMLNERSEKGGAEKEGGW